MDKRFFNSKFLFIAFFVFFGVPMALNFLLPVSTGLKILGKDCTDEGAILWLTFWASYLSAAGSFCVAYISYKVSKATLDQDTVRLMNDRWIRLIERYKVMEDFVVRMETVHSSFKIELVKTMNPNEMRQRYNELSSASLQIIRYMPPEDEFLLQPGRGSAINAYGICLRDLNKHWIKLVFDRIETRSSVSSTETGGNQSSVESSLSTQQNEEYAQEVIAIYNLYSKFIKLGMQLLQTEKRELADFAKKNDIPYSNFI